MRVIRNSGAFPSRAAWSLASTCLSAALACASPPPPSQAPERNGFVAQPCSGLELGSEPLDPADARVFVELVEVTASGLPSPVGSWLAENAVRVRSSVNLVAFPGVPTSMPWGQCVDAVCAGAQRSVTVTATLPERASEPVGLGLRIEEAPAEGSEAGPRLLLDTTLRAINQEPVVLPPAPEVSDGSVVVTAYLLRRPLDLQRVMECKVKQDERAKALP
jgi:hypothetical protein